MPTLAEKKAAMGAKVASDSAKDLIVPRLPVVQMPAKVERVIPELARWHRNNSDSLEQWREQVNTVLNRANTEQKNGTSALISEQRSVIDANTVAFTAMIADLQQQIDDLTP